MILPLLPVALVIVGCVLARIYLTRFYTTLTPAQRAEHERDARQSW